MIIKYEYKGLPFTLNCKDLTLPQDGQRMIELLDQICAKRFFEVYLDTFDVISTSSNVIKGFTSFTINNGVFPTNVDIKFNL